MTKYQKNIAVALVVTALGVLSLLMPILWWALVAICFITYIVLTVSGGYHGEDEH